MTRIDETLRRFEFEERFPDREFELSANHRELIHKIGAGLGDEVKPAAMAEVASVWRVQHEGQLKSFGGVTSSAALTKLAQAIQALPQSGGLASLLTAYASADGTLMWHERSAQAAFRAFEAAVQLQADIVRGK